MNNSMRKIIYYENILEYKENTRSRLESHEVNNWNLCRTCLQDSEDAKSTDFSGNGIFLMGMDGRMVNVKNLLVSATGLQILENDRLPTKICKECLTKISALHLFKLQTQRAKCVLERLLTKLDDKINTTGNSDKVQESVSKTTIIAADCSGNDDIGQPDIFEDNNFIEYDGQDPISKEIMDLQEEFYALDELIEEETVEYVDNDSRTISPNTKSVKIIQDNNCEEITSRSKRTKRGKLNKDSYPYNNYIFEEFEAYEETVVFPDVGKKSSPNKKSVKRKNACDSDAEEKSPRKKRNKGGNLNKHTNKPSKNYAVEKFEADEEIDECSDYDTGNSLNAKSVIKKESNSNVGKRSPRKNSNNKDGDSLLIDLSCLICKMPFSHQQSLINHVQAVHPNAKAFKCRYCEQTFSHIQLLSRHMQTHLGKRPQKVCSHCGKEFLRDYDLRRHVCKLTEQLPYVCEICEKGFKQASELRKHALTHKKNKKFQCDICGQILQSKIGLNIHKKVHVDDKINKCVYCEKRFITKGDLCAHLRVHNKVRHM